MIVGELTTEQENRILGKNPYIQRVPCAVRNKTSAGRSPEGAVHVRTRRAAKVSELEPFLRFGHAGVDRRGVFARINLMI